MGFLIVAISIGLATIVSCYEMGFLAEAIPDVRLRDQPEGFWNRYIRGLECAIIPPTDGGVINEIVLRIDSDLNAPKAMVFYRSTPQLGPDSVARDSSPCNDANIAFMVKWYPVADSLQIFEPEDPVFTHFSEIVPESYLWRDLQQLAEGDVLGQDINGDWDLLRKGVELLSPGILDAEEIIGADGGHADEDEDEDEGEDEEEDEEEESETSPFTESEFAQAKQILAGTGLLEGDTTRFQEMWDFEDNYPEFYDRLLQEFIGIRQRFLDEGSYIPVPIGLLVRYPPEELEDMGIVEDEREVDARLYLTLMKAKDPTFTSRMPSLFRLFEGLDPGRFNQLSVIADQIVNNMRDQREGRESTQASQSTGGSHFGEHEDIISGSEYLNGLEDQDIDMQYWEAQGGQQQTLQPSEYAGQADINIPDYSEDEDRDIPPWLNNQDNWSLSNQFVQGGSGLSAYSPAAFSVGREENISGCFTQGECLTQIEEEEVETDEFHPGNM
ncbi:hypothetical protein H072_8726 [Dactylellina haptotyla CBS 200.50]|uniref:Uncharacterized protein n=1 Tax=Dactylellina haptotyla (strain CBS 200.50) TaxID=1284197 RepID=S8BEA9_DACHA|nr:hypothetical protein H072_8726 [Dactylellina haptotyla CBS 200.50]